MTVRRCEQAGRPGWQWRPADGQAGECHLYDPADPQSESAALRAAARDGDTAVEAEMLYGGAQRGGKNPPD